MHYRLRKLGIIVKDPSFHITGNAHFYQLAVFSDPHVCISSLVNIRDKNVKFNIKYSDAVIFSNITYTGNAIVTGPEWAKLESDKIVIPWDKILVSPLHFTLLCALVICSIPILLFHSKKTKIKG
jgi:hypothetical protein